MLRRKLKVSKGRNKCETTLFRDCTPRKTKQQHWKERLVKLQAGWVLFVEWETLGVFILFLMGDFKMVDSHFAMGIYLT